jgi:hypothetical protein
MKKFLLLFLLTVSMLTFPKVNFGQAPNLGTTSSFAAFTAAGAFTNDGATVVTGDIGSFTGPLSGFPIPGTVIGTMHTADPVATTAKTDVLAAYGYLSTVTCGPVSDSYPKRLLPWRCFNIKRNFNFKWRR